jgi:hypothetical protein
MTHAAPKSKKARMTVYKPNGKKSVDKTKTILVFAPSKTRRGKTIYTEVDGAPHRDEGGEASKGRPFMTPSRSTTAVPSSFLDDQEPHGPRITKVRS